MKLIRMAIAVAVIAASMPLASSSAAGLGVSDSTLLNGQAFTMEGDCGVSNANKTVPVSLNTTHDTYGIGNVTLDASGKLFNATLTIPQGYAIPETNVALTPTLTVVCSPSMSLTTQVTVYGSEFQEKNPGAQVRALYRLYNPRIHNHFYTTSYEEALDATQKYGYSLEGRMGIVSHTNMQGLSPLYRMYSPSMNNHFYTTSSVEVEQAKKVGFRLEGMMGFMYPLINSPGSEGDVVYRSFSPSTGDHFYTTSLSEHQSVSRFGYNPESSLGRLVGR